MMARFYNRFERACTQRYLSLAPRLVEHFVSIGWHVGYAQSAARDVCKISVIDEMITLATDSFQEQLLLAGPCLQG